MYLLGRFHDHYRRATVIASAHLPFLTSIAGSFLAKNQSVVARIDQEVINLPACGIKARAATAVECVHWVGLAVSRAVGEQTELGVGGSNFSFSSTNLSSKLMIYGPVILTCPPPPPTFSLSPLSLHTYTHIYTYAHEHARTPPRAHEKTNAHTNTQGHTNRPNDRHTHI